MPNFWSDDDFFPDYFNNLQIVLRDIEITSKSLELDPNTSITQVTYRPDPIKLFKPFPPLTSIELLESLASFPNIPPVMPFKPFLPLPPSNPFEPIPLPPLRPFSPFQRFQPLRPFRPFKPFTPLPPLRPFRSFKPFPPLPPLRPLRPFKPFPPFPILRSIAPLIPFATSKPFSNYDNPFSSLDYQPSLNSDRAFKSNLENQKRAYTAARKAYDLTYNQAGYIPNLTTRFFDRPSFGGFGDFGYRMGDRANSAFAGGAVGPGFTHQVAAINPKNPHVSNVNVMNRFADTAKNNDNGGYYSVQSSSFVSSSNVDGKEKSHRKAETVVNRNGEVTQYKVED